MKLLFSSPDSASLGMIAGRLDAAGIPCEIRHEATAQAMVGFPFASELWVVRDEDYNAATELLHDWQRGTAGEDQTEVPSGTP